MNATSGGPEGISIPDEALPNVTQTPLVQLASQGDRVLDAAIRRLVDDVVNEDEVTAGFGNVP
jgi:FXSXX-COOH protein